jgi:DNA-dependent RNA polymerase auxiliary subunit epsilon
MWFTCMLYLEVEACDERRAVLADHPWHVL